MFEDLREKFPIDDATWKRYLTYYHKMEIPARTILLEEGKVSRRAFLIEKGCLRVWFNNKGKDVTFQFFFENEAVSSAESFQKNTPSFFTIETIEPSIVHWIHKKDLKMIMDEMNAHRSFREHFQNSVFDRQFHYMKQFLSFIKDTPTERYLNLLKERPEIIQRVPLHYIASYLGITPVSLSRIRNRIGH